MSRLTLGHRSRVLLAYGVLVLAGIVAGVVAKHQPGEVTRIQHRVYRIETVIAQPRGRRRDLTAVRVTKVVVTTTTRGGKTTTATATTPCCPRHPGRCRKCRKMRGA